MPANDQQEILIRGLSEDGILPLFYHDEAAVCIAVTKALFHAGARYIEFTNRGSKALENFMQLVKEKNKSMHGLSLGVGTIKSVKDAHDFISAGADFLVSPVIDEEISLYAQNQGIPFVPGCMTPTEIFKAERSGCSLVKLFPGNNLGVGFVDAVKVLFPSTRFIVTGGVEANEQSIFSWLDSGVIAVGLGSKLISKDILSNGDMDQLKERTQAILTMIRKRRTIS